MTKDGLRLTNQEVVLAADGVQVLLRLYMSKAADSPRDAQKAMEIASVAAALTAQAGVVRRTREILLAQYGNPQPGGAQGQQAYTLDPALAEEYNAALNNIMEALNSMTFEPITITAADIGAMANQPGALTAIRPIVKLPLE